MRAGRGGLFLPVAAMVVRANVSNNERRSPDIFADYGHSLLKFWKFSLFFFSRRSKKNM